jgi:hypothetical protein
MGSLVQGTENLWFFLKLNPPHLADSLARLASSPGDEVSDFPLVKTGLHLQTRLALGRAERNKRIRNARTTFGRN